MALTNVEIMMEARNSLKEKWGIAVGATVVYLVIVIIINSLHNVGRIVNIILGGPLQVGLASFYLILVRGNKPGIKNIFDGFSSFGNNLAAYLLMLLYIILWTLLLIVPGIIAAFNYSMTMFILADNPGLDASEALKKSKKMMNGNKAKLFYLYCRFIGWILLGFLTVGIGFLWITPYIMTSISLFYEDIRDTGDNSSNMVKCMSEM
ncbi:MAG: DUF975 family protein [Fibrobacter sp.]|nr:DUF975 family protein [Fibrobacter sp.]